MGFSPSESALVWEIRLRKVRCSWEMLDSSCKYLWPTLASATLRAE